MEWLSRMYVDSCLSMWLEAWRSEVLLKLATPFDTMYWDVDALIRPGVAEHMAALRTGVEAGIITRNEARDRLDLEPLEGLDEIIVALNMGTGGGKSNIGDDTSSGSSNDFPP
jgi:phage portal protein BeeE